MRKIIYLLLTVFAAASGVFAQQYTLSGTVASAQTGEKLVAANVYLRDLSIGEATDENGEYSFSVKKGRYTLVASYVGFETQEIPVNVNGDVTVNFELDERQFSLSVTVLADRAKVRETPVAFSNIDKRDMELRLGSRDIPLVLNTTPSVYSTAQGGGAGDARVNVRGFNQRNVAIMINGVPINDMENGWVYWSNWDGLGDATSSIQMQRGLSAINLATPSIGGTMNVITDPTAAQFGAKYKQEFGNDGFFKSTLSFNSGLVNDKFAVSGAVVRKVGDGVVDKTWTDAWAYYFGASYNINSANRLEVYAMGAPQRHGQNSYKQNIAAYSHDFAKDQGYSDAALARFPEAGRKYNENWNTVDPSYTGKQYFNGSEHDRYDESFINERENYYHKPLANLNWYSQMSKRFSLYTTLYYSGGEGGGAGVQSGRYITPEGYPSRIADWNRMINENRTLVASRGIMYNSVNKQWTLGAISKAYYKVSESFTTSFGVDWRTASIDHYREVRDLLGGEYFINENFGVPYNDFETTPEQRQKRLGDKWSYDNTNDVNWFGAYLQGEYTEGQITLYGMGGWSTIKYDFTDHFTRDTLTGGELELETDYINGYQFKGGASYRFTDDFNAYFNAGYVSKVPIFDQVIDDIAGELLDNDSNEEFISIEAGLEHTFFEKKLNVKANAYYTTWTNRAENDQVTIFNETTQDDEDYYVLLTGLDSKHIGVEFETAYQPVRFFRLDLAASVGDWIYTDDAQGTIKDYDNRTDTTVTAYITDIKVGDAPQTQFAIGGSIYPIDGLQFQAVYKYYANFFADWSAFNRIDPTDRTQSWETPSYGLLDLHLFYTLPIELANFKFQLFANAYNVFDTEYIQDALDNSPFNAFTANGLNHSADDAEVFFGLPRTFNLGISIAY